jgi:anionic glutamate receptor
MRKAKKIDVISRFLFPLIFAVFNLSYWSTYLYQASLDQEK